MALGFKRASIVTKVTLGILGVLLPLLATALGLGWNTRTRIKGQLADLSRARDVADLADRSLNLILTQDVVTYAILMDPENIADAPTKIEAYDALTAALHDMRTLSPNPEIASVIDGMARIEAAELRPLDTEILERTAGGETAKAREIFQTRYRPIRDRYAGLVRRLVEIASRDAAEATALAIGTNGRLFLLNALIFTIGVMATGAAVMLMLRRLSRRLGERVEQIGDVANGVLESAHRMDGGSDELGDLARAAARLAASLGGLVAEMSGILEAARTGDLARRGDADRFAGVYRELMASVNQILDCLAESATGLARQNGEATDFVDEVTTILDRVGNGELTARLDGRYEGAHRQAQEAVNHLIDILAAALTQVERSAEMVGRSGDAIEAAAQADAAQADAQERSVAEMAQLLTDLRSAAHANATAIREAASCSEAAHAGSSRGAAALEKLSTAIERIQASAQSTVKVARTIDDIAKRTNLLALNAEVEAARAGEGGRGFGVVAKEVKSLAARSAEGAHSTATLVATSLAQAETGMTVRRDALAEIGVVSERVSSLSSMLRRVSDSVVQQDGAISRIAAAMQTVGEHSRNALSRARGSGDAARTLAAEVDQLKRLFVGMRLRPDTTGGELTGSSAMTTRHGKGVGHASLVAFSK